MNIARIAENYFVSPQVSVEDIAALKAAGFVSIVCNRPDNEDPGQPSFETISAACKEEGLACFHIPVVGMPLAETDVAEHRRVVDDSNGKVLGYCRSGQRSAVIFSASMQ